MSTDLLTDLQSLGELLDHMSSPIALDQIVGREPIAIDNWQAFEPADIPVTRVRAPRPSPSRGWRAAVAIATAAAIIGALWLATSRPGADPDATGLPDATTPGAADGHMTLDSVPSGWRFETASDSVYPDTADFVIQRIYATSDTAPETLPALVLSSMGDVGEPMVGSPAESVTVQGAPGRLSASAGGGQSLFFGPVDGHNYLLVGYHVTRAELITAANTVQRSPDDYGAVIDAAALPAGVSERGAGFVSEIWFISEQAAAHPIPQAHWTDGTGALWYRSFEDPDMPPLGRFGFDAVTDTTVNGNPAYVATVEVDPLALATGQPRPPAASVASVTWSDGTRTFLLASNSIGAEQLLGLAAALRPATDDEWTQMTQVQPGAPTTEVATLSTAAPQRLAP
jgi:hypothetical protein